MWKIVLYGAAFFGLLISGFIATVVYVLLTDYDDDEEGPDYEEGWK